MLRIPGQTNQLTQHQSGAIMDYILEQYDTSKLISFSTLKEQYLMKQWLQLQTTTQGPLLQHIFHWAFLTANPTARARYVKEFRRILQVLDDELAEKQWLVGGKCSAADLSYVSFHSRIDFIMRDDAPDVAKEFPNVDTWYKRMGERAAVKKVLADHEQAFKDIAARGANIPGTK